MTQKLQRLPTLLLTLLLLVVVISACGSNADVPTVAVPAAGAAATATVAPAPAADTPATPAAAAQTPDMAMATTAPDTAAPVAATPTGAASGGQTTASGTTVQATLREWGLDLSQSTVAAGPVHFSVANTGNMAHNFTIKDAGGSVVAKTSNFSPSAGPQTLDVTLAAGTYTVYCSLPGHAARGQQNTLVVK